jgi:hypothetical protein
MELIGRVLWWSIREQHGIIVDPQGNEFFFDISVVDLKPKQKIKPESVVTFKYNSNVNDCLCARKVRVPQASKVKSFESKFFREAQI